MISKHTLIKCLTYLFSMKLFMTGLVFGQMTKSQIDSLKKLLVPGSEDTNQIRILLQLADNVGYYDNKEALAHGMNAIQLAEKINFPFGRAKAAYSISTTLMDMGNFQQADSFMNIAENTESYIARKDNVGRISNARGMEGFMKGNYYEAASYFSKSTEIYDQLKDTANSLIAYQNLISALAEVKNYEQAVHLGKKVLTIVRARNDTLEMGYTLQGLTTDLIYLDRMGEAEQYLPDLLNIAGTNIDHNLAADSYSTAGTFYYHKKDYQKSLTYFLEALAKAEQLGNKFQLANHKKSLGSAYLALNNLPLAKKYLDESYQLAKENHNLAAEYGDAHYLSNYFEKIGDNKKALYWMQQHLDLKDSIMNQDTRNHTSYLEAQFESKKKENEILRLQQIQEEKELAIRKRNLYIMIGTGILVLMIIISSLLYRNFRNQKKISEQEKFIREEKISNLEKQQQVLSLQSMINGQETERTRIAKDLHDGLGGIFSTVKMHFSSLQHNLPALAEDNLYRKTLDLVNHASESLREIAHNMMPEVLMKLGLIEALRDFCNNISAGKLLDIKLQSYGMEKRLGTSTEIMLYRIIQELVNNIIKHAYATTAIIQFNRDDRVLHITVEDNGRGFDTANVEEKRAMGIEAVKSRVVYLNGKIAIDSRQNVGTTVSIDLLLNEN